MDRRLAELHLIKARDLGFRIFAYSSTVFPKEFCVPTFNDLIVTEVTEFAFHARRVVQILDVGRNCKSANSTRFKDDEGIHKNFIDDYIYSLNRIVHAKNIILGYCRWSGSKSFLKSTDEQIPMYLEVETDHFSSGMISIFGLSFSFMTEIIQEIKEKYPHIMF